MMPNHHNVTPLDMASQLTTPEAQDIHASMLAFVEQGLEKRDARGMTPLATLLAADHQNDTSIEWLINKGADAASFLMPDGRTNLLHLAVRHNKSPAVIELLFKSHVSWRCNSLDPEDSLLFAACAVGSLPLVRLLLDRGDRPWTLIDGTATESATTSGSSSSPSPPTTTTTTSPCEVGIFCEEMLARVISSFGSDTSARMEALRTLEAAGLDISRHIGSASRHRLLCEAVRHAQHQTVELLLSRDSPIELDDDSSEIDQLLSSRQGSSAIRIAMERSYFSDRTFVAGRAGLYSNILVQLIKKSIERGRTACANTLSTERGSLLYHAATKLRSKELVQFLLEAGADINLTGRFNAEGEPCGMLSTVLLENQTWDSVAELLLAQGASPTQVDRRGMSPIHHVCHRPIGDAVRALRQLIQAGADVNVPWNASSLDNSLFSIESQGITPLMMVVMNQAAHTEQAQMSMLDELLKAKAQVDLTEHPHNWTALLLVSNAPFSEHRAEIATKLLEAGADPMKSLLTTGQSAWSFIANNNGPYAPRVIEAALERGAPANGEVSDSNGEITRPLLLCVKTGILAALQHLLRARADVNFLSPRAETALSLAVDRNLEEIAMELLNQGANPNQELIDQQGVINAPILIRAASSWRLVSSLLQHSCNPNVVHTPTGQTPLHTAVQADCLASCQLLLKYGAVPMLNPITHQNPLSLAILERRSPQIRELLYKAFTGECSVCGEVELLHPLRLCGHAFCESCLSGWITTHASGAGPIMTCANTGCEQEIDITDVRRFLTSTELFEAYDRRIAEMCCNMMEDFAWCPKCPIGGVVGCAETICTGCGFTWCGFCRGPAHAEGEACPIEQNIITVLLYKKANTRPCPACGVATEHNGGCSHMVCVSHAKRESDGSNSQTDEIGLGLGPNTAMLRLQSGMSHSLARNQ